MEGKLGVVVKTKSRKGESRSSAEGYWLHADVGVYWSDLRGDRRASGARSRDFARAPLGLVSILGNMSVLAGRGDYYCRCMCSYHVGDLNKFCLHLLPAELTTAFQVNVRKGSVDFLTTVECIRPIPYHILELKLAESTQPEFSS